MRPTEHQIINMAIGRIFLMGLRPEQPGDGIAYERCRKIILDLLDPENATRDYVRSMTHDAARDHRLGAQGD